MMKDDLLFAIAHSFFVVVGMVVLAVWLSYDKRECPAPQFSI